MLESHCSFSLFYCIFTCLKFLQPNMLVVDVEKFVSPEKGKYLSCFS